MKDFFLASIIMIVLILFSCTKKTSEKLYFNPEQNSLSISASFLHNCDSTIVKLDDRKVIQRNITKLLEVIEKHNVQPGIIKVKLAAENNGDVSYVELLDPETTDLDKKVMKDILKAIYGYKFTPITGEDVDKCYTMQINLTRS